MIIIVVELRRQNEELRRQIDELLRKGGRSAAPFSKGQRKEHPKPLETASREKGFSRGEKEPPSEANCLEVIDVPVACHRCPDCGGALGEAATETASSTDLPELPRPVVRRYEVEVRQCGPKVRGGHAELAPDQFGATAHRLGARLKAAAHVSMRQWLYSDDACEAGRF
ncbi:MAG: hypothetical protein M3Y07_07375 [Acidobacteriota bacterium]|nr:hypothetical protein [Acidobacteriota bacterium]